MENELNIMTIIKNLFVIDSNDLDLNDNNEKESIVEKKFTHLLNIMNCEFG